MSNFYETIVGRGVPEDDIFENLNVMSDLQDDLETYGKLYQSNQLTSSMSSQQLMEVQTLLAQRCDNFVYDYDLYGYQDNLNGTREDSVNAIRDDLSKGRVKGYLTGIDSMGLGISDDYVSKYETIDKIESIVNINLDLFEPTDSQGYEMAGSVRYDGKSYNVDVTALSDDSYNRQVAEQIYEEQKAAEKQAEDNKNNVSKRKLPEGGEEMLEQLESNEDSNTYQR